MGDADKRYTYYADWMTRWGALSWFSSVGEGVEIAAPGAKILSLISSPDDADARDLVSAFQSDETGYITGTSQAAPFVTGIASLLSAIRPELTAGQLKQRLLDGARRGGRAVYRPLQGEAVERFSYFVANAGESLAIIEREGGCADADADGFDATDAQGAVGLDCPRALADCDDTDPAVYPGAVELCDGVDNDCNGHTDEENVCEGSLAGAPVSGVVPGAFDVAGGTFRLSVSPIDPNGELVHRELSARNFSFRDIEVERLDQPGVRVAEGIATATDIEVQLPGAAREHLRLLLLFDSSGSMAESDGARRRVAAARDLLRQLAPEDELAVMDFGAGGGLTRLLAPMSTDRAVADAGLQQVTADGGTPMFQGVIEAVRYLRGFDGRRVLVLLSDGQANSDDVPYAADAIADAVDAAVTVYAVGLGASLDFSLLEQLSDGTEGTFAFARDAQVLRGLFDAIGVAAARGRVVHGEGEFSPALSEVGRYLVRGVLRTQLGAERVDTPFDFTVDVRAQR